MNYSGTILMFLRRLFRKTKLTNIFHRILYGVGYEGEVDKIIKKYVQPKDTVWDVGANIGLYTSLFANLVGENGKVFAFEPHPETYSKLLKCSEAKNIKYLNLALSNVDGDLSFSDKDSHDVNSIVDASYEGDTVTVKVSSSDNVVSNDIASIPNFIKIDVEGFEYFVLLGMKSLLLNSNLTSILIEVHFSRLDQLKLPKAPEDITKILLDSGFKLIWIDSSHLFAKR